MNCGSTATAANGWRRREPPHPNWLGGTGSPCTSAARRWNVPQLLQIEGPQQIARPREHHREAPNGNGNGKVPQLSKKTFRHLLAD